MHDTYIYEGLEQYDIPMDRRSQYCYFAVKQAATGRVLYDLYTSRAFEGIFYHSDYDQTYHQTQGTCQFNLGNTRSEARRHLRKMAVMSIFRDKFGFSADTYAEAERELKQLKDSE